MRIDGWTRHHEALANETIERRSWEQEYRLREREHTAPGPVTIYTPYAGIYRVTDEHGHHLGYADRTESGQWVPAEVRPLLATIA